MSDDTTPQGRAKPRLPDSAKIKIKGKWTAIPNKLMTDQRLSRDARMLGCLMFMHAGNSSRTFPTQEQLANELSFTAQVPVTDDRGQTVKDDQGRVLTEEVRREISVRSVQRWLSELKAAGWIDWRQTMRNNAYTLLDPTEATTNRSSDLGLNDALTGATEVSPRKNGQERHDALDPTTTTTEVSQYTATEGSPRATEGSPRATEGSPRATEVSYPSSYKDSLDLDSLDLDSSSSDNVTDDDDDDHASHQETQITHTASSQFLAQRGVNAALEFRDLPLEVIAQVWDDIMGRDLSATPGAVVKALRTIAQLRTEIPVPPAHDAERTPTIDETHAHAEGAGITQIWQGSLRTLQSQITRGEFDTWLRGAQLIELVDHVAVIAAPSVNHQGWLDRHHDLIRRAIGDELGIPVTIRVVRMASVRG